mmetsp:Transcript_26913/g.91882  ORF Transcript_26913/g.91882 Transcript_26913/m.91882 type:complete len:125 (+) Transcript_26913:2-376(+)
MAIPQAAGQGAPEQVFGFGEQQPGRTGYSFGNSYGGSWMETNMGAQLMEELGQSPLKMCELPASLTRDAGPLFGSSLDNLTSLAGSLPDAEAMGISPNTASLWRPNGPQPAWPPAQHQQQQTTR